MWFGVLAVTIITSLSDAARILGYFPTPSFSHHVTFRALTEALLKRGHEITIVTPQPVYMKGQTPTNLTEIDVHDVSFKIWREHFTFSATGKQDIFAQMKSIMKIFSKVHEQQLLNEEIKDIVNNKNATFDLLLLELSFRPAWVLSHVIKAPTIFISSLGGVYDVYNVVGAPTHPFLYPRMTFQKTYNLSFWEKITVFYYNNYLLGKIYNGFSESEDELNKKIFGPDTPSVRELIKNLEMLFLNVHPIWEGNRPVPPNVIFMGGIQINRQKELPKELKGYLDSSKNGVIYISFGTNVVPSLLPRDRIQILVNVFSALPYDVLWKYDKDELPGKSKNIRIEKWLPQSDLLRHPKIKLFITQGGMQSTDEAIAAGVPLIGVPMLGDQWYNVENYLRHKIGIKVDIETLTEDTFRNAIKTVMEDKSYRQNIVRLRELMNDQPQRPLDRAVWWAEYVIRHKGAKFLKSMAVNMSWAEYYEVELISILLVILLSLVSTISVAVYFIWRYFVYGKCNMVKLKNS